MENKSAPVDAERTAKHQRIVEIAEQLAAIMRTEPDKNMVLDAYALAMSFWRR
jgi:hypothetical protein